MKPHRRVSPFLIWLVGAVLVLVNGYRIAIAQSSSTHNLLEQATRTAITVTPDFDDTDAYFWLSPHEILFLRPAPGYKQFRIVLTNVQTGSKNVPVTFNTYASPRMPRIESMSVSYADSKEVKKIYQPPQSILSPDGKWLLWQARTLSPPSWYAATIDGNQRYQWLAAPGADFAFWLPEGRGWLELSRGADDSMAYRRVLIHSLSSKDRPQIIPWIGVGDGIPLGVTRKKSVLVYYPNRTLPEKKQQVPMAEVGLGPKPERAHRFTIVLPHPAEVAKVVLSPGGDRLVWLLTDGTAYSEHGEVWLSDTHGKQMQWLGRLEGESAWSRMLHWLPDGKHLSFVHQSAIWTVEIPSENKYSTLGARRAP